ncbi:hypothetical protein ACFV4T_18920 [Streptomyces sp. NPDC059755]|uniref:hypothetical protein n=1 Tax=Streptomyces sp. NPDC059755 TaxID=3346934 RepID=UPI0036642EAD
MRSMRPGNFLDQPGRILHSCKSQRLWGYQQHWSACRGIQAGQPRHPPSLRLRDPRLRFNAVEPGFNPGTGLRRDANPALRLLATYVFGSLAPLMPGGNTPKRAARVITGVLTDASDSTGVYHDEKGHPMLGSAQVRDTAFQDRLVAETRALLKELICLAATSGFR